MSRVRAVQPSHSGAAARRAAVDAEIDEEFALHLELLERELIESGAEPMEARRLAAARFGDLETFRATCRRIALKEQIMLERINTVALVLVVAGMVYLAMRVESTQARTAAAITTIAERLQTVPAPPTGGERAPQPDASVPPVYIGGGVKWPGPYQLLSATTTFRQMLIAAGGVTATGDSTMIHIIHADGSSESLDAAELSNITGKDIVLRPGDRIEIREPAAAGAASSPPPSKAGAAPEPEVVYIAGAVARPGVYSLPDGGLSLRRLIEAAGGLLSAEAQTVTIVRDNGTSEAIGASGLSTPGGADLTLRPGDRVEVR